MNLSKILKANQDNTTVYQQNYEDLFWLFSLLITIILTITSLWLVATIACYGFRTRKFYSSKSSNRSESKMLRTMFASSIFLLIRLITTNILVWFGWDPSQDLGCEILVDSSVIIYFVSLYPVGLFLWFRQRCLYLQPSLRRLYSILIKCISWGCILFLTGSGTGFVLYLSIPQSYKASSNGCTTRGDDVRTIYYILASVLVIGECLLIGLFVYPLYHHRKLGSTNRNIKQTKKESSTNQGKTNQTSTVIGSAESSLNFNRFKSSQCSTPVLVHKHKSQPGMKPKKSRSVRTEKKVIRVMKRSVVSACVCVASDVLAFAAVAFFLSTDTVTSFRNTLYDINLIVNVLSLAFSFENYKTIFSALFMKENSRNEKFVSQQSFASRQEESRNSSNGTSFH